VGKKIRISQSRKGEGGKKTGKKAQKGAKCVNEKHLLGNLQEKGLSADRMGETKLTSTYEK